MTRRTFGTISRRRFVQTTAAGAVATIGAPSILTAKKIDSPLIVGEGDHQYRVEHAWPKLPDKYTWQTTHNVAVDKANNLYVIHEGRQEQKDHPSIFVFDAKGKFVRAFGSEFQGGGHGIEVHEEDGTEYLYVCAYQNVKAFAKMTLKGETVWKKLAPQEAEVYNEEEYTAPVKKWGRDRFLPTNFAFLPDGDFLLADGYGAFYIHRYDKEGNWKSKFGGPGKGEGKFQTPHGIWFDDRKGGLPEIVICDRAHHTLQFLTLDGEHKHTMEGYGLPANIDTYKNLMLVPELHARVTILNEKNEVVARLGSDVERVTTGKGIRNDKTKWLDGKFVHPHDACFDNEGNIFVAEWVQSGRVTKLTKVT